MTVGKCSKNGEKSGRKPVNRRWEASTPVHKILYRIDV
jgi:hypothetical protein